MVIVSPSPAPNGRSLMPGFQGMCLRAGIIRVPPFVPVGPALYSANMPLWAPYALESPLDLSTSKLKENPRRNVEAITTTTPVAFPYAYRYLVDSPIRVDISQPVTPHTDFYSVDKKTVSSAQMSPQSVASNMPCSSCAPAVHHGVVSPLRQDTNEFEPLDEDIEYQRFERDALRVMAEKNGGTLLGNNPHMRRAVQTKETADDNYRKQRERNNFAAKQSRDRRKLREVRLALQVKYLKKKMTEMRSRLATGVCVHCQH